MIRPIPPLQFGNPFLADHDAVTWDGPLGPVWIDLDWTQRRTTHTADADISRGFEEFLAAAVAMIMLDEQYIERGRDRRPAFGAAYAVRHPIGCNPGDLHFDGGRYDPDRNVQRVIASWSSLGEEPFTR